MLICNALGLKVVLTCCLKYEGWVYENVVGAGYGGQLDLTRVAADFVAIDCILRC